MKRNTRPLNVALLAVPQVTGSTLHGMFDLFASAGRDWTFFTHGRVDTGAATPYIVARELRPVPAFNGITITPHHTLADGPPPDILCISDFFIAPGESCAGLFEAEIAWIRRHYQSGAVVAAALLGLAPPRRGRHSRWPRRHHALGLLQGDGGSLSQGAGALQPHPRGQRR